MKTSHTLSIIFSTLIFILIPSLSIKLQAQISLREEVDAYTKNLPFHMEQLQIPSFPQKYFDITKYGAVGNGVTKNTKAIQAAIDECANAGGGYVIVPSGLWSTGPIELRSNVNLHLEKGALIVFSADHNDYPLIKNPSKSGYINQFPILANKLENVAITGDGLINGNGQTWRPVKKSKMNPSQWKELLNKGGALNKKQDMWWPSKQAADAEEFLAQKSVKDLTIEDYQKIKDYFRPHLALFVNCKNILLDGPTFENSANMNIYIHKSRNIIVRDVKIFNEWWAQNADGIDLSASQNALIYKCTVNTGDDGICMKSDKIDKKSNEPALKNIVIRDCVVLHAHGGFVLGSNTFGGMKNIFVQNCTFNFTDVGLRFKSGNDKGGLVEDIYIQDIYMKDIADEAISFDLFYVDSGAPKTTDQKDATRIPTFKNIKMNNVNCDGAAQAFLIKSLTPECVSNIEISNSVFIADKGIESSEASNITFKNVIVKSLTSPLISLNNSFGFTFDNFSCGSTVDLFIKLNGEKTKNITLINTKTDCAKIPFEFGEGVSKEVVNIK
ncbi:MAG: glycoside hydrolase family 28 protein [Ignavibacteria bacterium]|nr:glycoside hydrolase family 28 protein [Ignavibacteria bacterium]